MRQFTITLLLAGLLLLPDVTHAQSSDPRCFTRQQCLDARRNIGIDESDVAAGFFGSSKNNDALASCGATDFTGQQEMGFCLPSSVARTQITIGGKNEFKDIGEFIKLFYQYGIALIGLFSTIMIIVAGAQWVTSGGSPDKVTSAKKRIAGAVTGLILAVSAYTILNTINPNLLRFRLPQIWMVNSFDTAANLCGDLVKPDQPIAQQTDLALATRKIGPSTPSAELNKILTDAFSAGTKKPSDPTLGCGTEYFVDGTGGQTCVANRCPNDGEVCVKGADPTVPEKFACVTGNIVATVYNSSLTLDLPFTEDWAWPWVDIDIDTLFRGLCKDGKQFTIANTPNATTLQNEKKQILTFTLQSRFKTRDGLTKGVRDFCDTLENFYGFYFYLPMNESSDPFDENHAVGKNGVDLGYLFAVEQSFQPNAVYRDKRFFYQIEDLDIFGLNVTIDAAKITDVD